MHAIHITAASVFVIAFIAGVCTGTVTTEKRIAAGCLAGERVQIAAIRIQCPARPVWRDR